MSERRSLTVKARCYLCAERRPKGETEVTRYRVPSALAGGLVDGVDRYVRMCRVGYGCKAADANDPERRFGDSAR